MGATGRGDRGAAERRPGAQSGGASLAGVALQAGGTGVCWKAGRALRRPRAAPQPAPPPPGISPTAQAVEAARGREPAPRAALEHERPAPKDGAPLHAGPGGLAETATGEPDPPRAISDPGAEIGAPGPRRRRWASRGRGALDLIVERIGAPRHRWKGRQRGDRPAAAPARGAGRHGPATRRPRGLAIRELKRASCEEKRFVSSCGWASPRAAGVRGCAGGAGRCGTAGRHLKRSCPRPSEPRKETGGVQTRRGRGR